MMTVSDEVSEGVSTVDDIHSVQRERLRELARQGASVPEIILRIKSDAETTVNKGNFVHVLAEFRYAFDLTLREVRIIEGAACMGNMAVSDEELDSILRPLILERISVKEPK
jgi:hypothetical protein